MTAAAEFTVAVPTYNGAQRLPQVLDALRCQVGDLTWEAVVVDNNSQDDTAAVVRQAQQNWPSNSSLRYCFEPTQGLAFARSRAIAVATAPLVGFLDDDVVPARDWVQQAHRFAQEHPQAGAYGGQIHGEFEQQPPDNFHRIQALLAIREGGEQPYRYRAESLSLPPGAALVVRRAVWQDCSPAHPELVGRVNGKMLSGEDYEVLMHMHQRGWQIWYAPSLHSYHQIPAHRLERPYLMSLAQGCGLCICPLRLINISPWKQPAIMARIVGGNLKRLMLHYGTHGLATFQDPVLACEAELWRSAMMSPFFFLRQKLTSLV